MKKWIIGIVITLAAVLLLLNYTSSTSQADLEFQKPVTTLGEFPILNGMINTAHDVALLIDTGSDKSMITPSTIQSLKEQGMRVDSSFCPVFFYDNTGKLRFTTKRYTVDLPIAPFTAGLAEDGSMQFTPAPALNNVIRNVDFVPAPHNANVLGLDFLSKFAVEFNVDHGTVSFHASARRAYEKVTDLKTKTSLYNLLGCKNRLYLPLMISGHTNDYFVDTALDMVQVKLPEKDTVYTHSVLEPYTILTAEGRMMKVKLAQKEWAVFGSREGSIVACYYDDGDENYAINPLQFSTQDVLLDFPNGHICYHSRMPEEQ